MHSNSFRDEISAQYGAEIHGMDTKQAVLYGDMAKDADIYMQSQDWWFDPIPKEYVFRLKKAIYGNKHATRRWHTRISSWIEESGYPAVNSEKMIFMKRTGNDFIIHGLFLDDIKLVPTKKALLDESIARSSKSPEGSS
jgi:hypothetical protein